MTPPTCPCTSRNGDPKRRWPRREAAAFVADLAQRKDGLLHDVYPCPVTDGIWHVATRRDRDGHPIRAGRRK